MGEEDWIGTVLNNILGRWRRRGGGSSPSDRAFLLRDISESRLLGGGDVAVECGGGYDIECGGG